MATVEQLSSALKNADAAYKAGGPNAAAAADAARKFASAIKDMQAPASDAPSRGSILDPLAQGLTLGFSDEIGAGVVGAVDWMKGEEFGKGYDDTLKTLRDNLASYQEAHPVLSTAAEIGGSLPSMLIPGMGEMEGATWGLRALRAAKAGGILGGAYGAGTSDGNLTDRAVGAAEGALTGAGLGGAGSAAMSGIGSVVDHLAPVKTLRGLIGKDKEAARQVASAATRDAGSVDAAADQMEAGQRAGVPLTAADTGNTTRTLSKVAAIASPEARTTLEKASDERLAGQRDRAIDKITQIAPRVSAGPTRDALHVAARAANKPAYDKAYAEGASGIWTPEIAQLTVAPAMRQAMQDAVKTGANKAAVVGQKPPVNPFTFNPDGSFTMKPGAKPTLQFWDHVKQNLQDAYTRAARTGDKGAAADITSLKNSLVAHLDAAAPSYKAARQGAAAFFGADNALDAGTAFAKGRVGDNAGARKAYAKMSKPERQLFAEAFASEKIEQIRNAPDRRSVVNLLLNSPAERERFEMALGMQGTKDMEAYLRLENVTDLLQRALKGGSDTVRNAVQMSALGGSLGIAATGGNPLNPHEWLTPRAWVGALLAMGAKHGQVKIDNALAQRIAEMLTSGDPDELRQAAKAVARSDKLQKVVKSAEDFLTRSTTIPAVNAEPKPLEITVDHYNAAPQQ